jgi:2',3'-cyclic-nucleotide 2'-phosphodiesterase (5'-nucleotidase family)
MARHALLAVLACILLTSCASNVRHAPSSVDVSVLATNDFHGNFENAGYP